MKKTFLSLFLTLCLLLPALSQGPQQTFSAGQPNRAYCATALGAGATTIGPVSVPAAKKLRIEIYISGYAGADTASLRFNGDTGANYRAFWLTAAPAGTTFAAGTNNGTGIAQIPIAPANATTQRNVTAFVSNDSGNTEKTVKFSSVTGTGAVGTQANEDLGNGAWVSAASTSITSVSLITPGGQNMGARSNFCVIPTSM